VAKLAAQGGISRLTRFTLFHGAFAAVLVFLVMVSVFSRGHLASVEKCFGTKFVNALARLRGISSAKRFRVSFCAGVCFGKDKK
jgi:hypothetical protein